MASKLTDAEQAEVDAILARESSLGYEIQYEEAPAPLPFLHRGDRERAEAEARRRADTGREATPDEAAVAANYIKRNFPTASSRPQPERRILDAWERF